MPEVPADLIEIVAKIRGVSIWLAIGRGIGADHEDVVKALRAFNEKIEC